MLTLISWSIHDYVRSEGNPGKTKIDLHSYTNVDFVKGEYTAMHLSPAKMPETFKSLVNLINGNLINNPNPNRLLQYNSSARQIES